MTTFFSTDFQFSFLKRVKYINKMEWEEGMGGFVENPVDFSQPKNKKITLRERRIVSFSSFGSLIHHDLLSTEKRDSQPARHTKTRDRVRYAKEQRRRRRRRSQTTETTKPKDRTRISSPVVGEAPTHTRHFERDDKARCA